MSMSEVLTTHENKTVCLCVCMRYNEGKRRKESKPWRACQPPQVMKYAWRLRCQFASAKAAEKEHRRGFLNCAAYTV